MASSFGDQFKVNDIYFSILDIYVIHMTLINGRHMILGLNDHPSVSTREHSGIQCMSQVRPSYDRGAFQGSFLFKI